MMLRIEIEEKRSLFKDWRGSPLVEEGLLIGLAILVFIVIVTIVSNILEWLKELASQLPQG